jgi:hypothetical protein
MTSNSKYLYIGNQDGPLSLLNGYEGGSFTVGTNIVGDPAYGCPKNFVSTYMCGNKQKSINIDGEAGGKRAIYNCSDEVAKCQTNYATLQNDGNFVLYEGSPENKGNALWSSSSAGTLSDSNRKNLISGKENLLPGEILGANTPLVNSNENGFVEVNVNGEINVFKRIMREGEKLLKKYGLGGDDTSYALYELNPKKPSINMFKTGYVDIDTKLHSYPSSMLEYRNNYTPVIDTNAPGYDIEAKGAIGKEACEESCNANLNCGIYQTDSNNNCWLKTQDAYTKGNVYTAPGMTTYLRTKGPIKDKYKYKNYQKKDSSGHDLYCSTSGIVKNKQEMQNLCDKNDQCAAYNWNESSKVGCLKDNSAYSEDNTTSNFTTSDSYEYNVKIKSSGTTPFLGSCSKDVSNVNNLRWKKYLKGPEMTSSTLCGLARVTEEDKKLLKESELKLEKIIKELKNRINKLTSKEINLNQHMIDKYHVMVKELGDFKKQYKKYKKSKKADQNIEAWNEDSYIQMMSENNRNIIFSVIAIIFIIVLIKIKKV